VKAVVYAVALVNELKKQAGHHELNIGHAEPKLKAMILTSQTEYRAPPPPELLREYKPVCTEAAQVGSLVKSTEKVVEAWGRRFHLEMEQSEQHVLVSSSWDPEATSCDPEEELGQSLTDFWFDPDEEIQYDKLDDVPLPTQTLPLYQTLMERLIHMNIMHRVF
jgi:hypothetical protein